MQPSTPHKKTYAFDYDSVFSEVRERIEILGLIDYQHRVSEDDIEDMLMTVLARRLTRSGGADGILLRTDYDMEIYMENNHTIIIQATHFLN